MNTFDIHSCLSKDPFTKSSFKGVYARDAFLKQKLSKGSMYVCNLDESDETGSHWVAIYLPSATRLEYFDSYGMQPLYPDLQAHLHKTTQHVMSNSVCLQGLNSVVCGQYCICYLTLRARNYDMSEIVKMFANFDAEQRDHAVYSLINKYFRKARSFSQLSVHKFNKVL